MVAILQKAFWNLLSVQGKLVSALRHITGNALLESREQQIFAPETTVLES